MLSHPHTPRDIVSYSSSPPQLPGHKPRLTNSRWTFEASQSPPAQLSWPPNSHQPETDRRAAPSLLVPGAEISSTTVAVSSSGNPHPPHHSQPPHIANRSSRFTFLEDTKEAAHQNARNGIQTLVHPHDGRFKLIEKSAKSSRGCPCVPSMVWDWFAPDARVELRVPGCGPAGDRNLFFLPHLARSLRLCFGGGSCGGYGTTVLPERGMVKCLDESLSVSWNEWSYSPRRRRHLLGEGASSRRLSNICRPHLIACQAQV